MKKKLVYTYMMILMFFTSMNKVRADGRTDGCSELLGSNMVKEIKDIFYILGYVALAIGIVLGMFDFIKTITGGDKAELKVVGQKFVKRLLAISLFFILPTVVSWLLELSGIPHGGTCIGYEKK